MTPKRHLGVVDRSLLADTWGRTRESFQVDLIQLSAFLAEGRRPEAGRVATDLANLLRSAGLVHAHQACEAVLAALPGDEVFVALLRLRRELGRLPSALPARQGPPLETVWVRCEDLEILDGLTVAAAARGWRLQHGGNPPPGAVCIVHLPFDLAGAFLCQLERDVQCVVTLAPGPDVRRLQLCRAGANLIVSDDLMPHQLLDVAARLLARKETRPLRLLMLEDDVISRRVVSRQLEQAGFQVTALSRPAQFWSELERVQPDVLLFDFYLPGLLGSDLCSTVRSHPVWGNLPIFFLTGSSDPQDLREIYRAGADDCLTKPIAAHDLTERLQRRLQFGVDLRAQGDRDPHSSLPGRTTTLEQLALLWGVARRERQALSLCLVERDQPLAWTDCDILGKLDQRRWLACRYGEARSDMLERAADGAGEGNRCVVAAYPADGPDPLQLVSAMAVLLPTCSPGLPRALNHRLHHFVLVRQDDAESQELLQIMRQSGWNAECFYDWHTLHQALLDPTWQVDTLLLDVDLPLFDTPRFLTHFASSAHARATRLYALAAPDPELALRLTEAGVGRVITKPIEVVQLADQLRHS